VKKVYNPLRNGDNLYAPQACDFTWVCMCMQTIRERTVCGRETKIVHARFNRKLMLPCSYCAGRSGTVFV